MLQNLTWARAAGWFVCAALIAMPARARVIDCDRERPRVAVIGAGVGGLAVANALRDRGCRDVIVYESESVVGGKITTERINGRPYEMGAIVAFDSDLEIRRLARVNHVRTADEVMRLRVIDASGRQRDFADYQAESAGLLELWDAVTRFKLLQAAHRPRSSSLFADADPSLAEPMDAWAERNGVTLVADLTRPGVIGCGYGYFETVPALYYIGLVSKILDAGHRLASPMPALVPAGRLLYFPDGFDSLPRAMARNIEVRLGQPVTDVTRQPLVSGGTRVVVTAGARARAFDVVVVATSFDRAASFLDETDEERDLMSRVRTVAYRVTLFRASGLPTYQASFFSANDTVDRVGEVAAIVNRQGGDVHVAYQIVDESVSRDQARANLEGQVRSMGGAMGEVLKERVWRYFPHVGPEDVAGGFYRRMETLQGRLGTFYVGGLMNFETVNDTAVYARHLVERHFR